MTYQRKCRWCFELFDVHPSTESRYHCGSCWGWIITPMVGTVKLRKQFTVRMPKRFRDTKKLPDLRIGK